MNINVLEDLIIKTEKEIESNRLNLGRIDELTRFIDRVGPSCEGRPNGELALARLYELAALVSYGKGDENADVHLGIAWELMQSSGREFVSPAARRWAKKYRSPNDKTDSNGLASGDSYSTAS